jgi:hypothetical protein
MNAPRPNIVVAGLARCGTSVTMQMLHAGGVPCIGEWPAFEVGDVNGAPVDPAFMARYPGHALKVLDPHRTKLPPLASGGVLIWLDRDPVEQARSQAKFVHLMTGVPVPNRAHMRSWTAGLRSDRVPALAQFGGWPKLLLDFEQIVTDPRRAARSIATRLEPWWPNLDAERMADQVRPRPPACAPDLAMELRLVAEAGAGFAPPSLHSSPPSVPGPTGERI